ncbi:MAG TPA: cytochrome c [Acetobacteraceae bacterium]|nr:cytochrome c [Acetobacteraceae bacterium]
MKVLVSAAAALCFGSHVCYAQFSDQQDYTLIARGQYLAHVGDCFACHTAPGGKPFAGGRSIQTPFGNLLSPNITPDVETGIGGWSEDKFYRTMHEGISDERLYPAMPYPYYTKTSRQDVLAIRAWLNTVEPVNNPVHSDTLPFPFNIRASMIGWNWLYFTPNDWQNRSDKSAEWNRGGYLVEGLGHCGACHTPKTVLGGDKNGRHLQGYALQGWFAPEISKDAHTGLGTWSADDIVEYLKTGTNKFATASGPMAEEVTDSTSHISLTDLHAMAVYLLDQPGASDQPKTSAVAPTDPQMQAGQAIYLDNCAGCHTIGGNGIARLFPTLKGSASVQSAKPDSVLQVILNGTRAVSTQWAPTGPAMPTFAWKLSDAEVAAVATYVRNAWGNSAPPVTAADAHNARQNLAQGGG